MEKAVEADLVTVVPQPNGNKGDGKLQFKSQKAEQRGTLHQWTNGPMYLNSPQR
jgi:hypothetical protein